MIPRFLSVLLLLVVAGCDSKDSSSPQPPFQKGRRELQSNGGGYTVTLEASPDPIPMNQLFDLTIRVASKGGAPAPAVEVDARMPAHGHGMNRVPKVTRQADGSYKAEGMLFHMPGHWELYVDLSQGGKTERTQVDVDLK
ncbi:MAG: FixH family protein [Planctomycetes bacterium]|nr:FixH family protein [Planctomycetota bacterium]